MQLYPSHSISLDSRLRGNGKDVKEIESMTEKSLRRPNYFAEEKRFKFPVIGESIQDQRGCWRQHLLDSP